MVRTGGLAHDVLRPINRIFLECDLLPFPGLQPRINSKKFSEAPSELMVNQRDRVSFVPFGNHKVGFFLTHTYLDP